MNFQAEHWTPDTPQKSEHFERQDKKNSVGQTTTGRDEDGANTKMPYMLFDKAYAIPQLAGMCLTICLAGVAPHGLKRNVHQNRKHRCSVQAIQHVGNHALH